MKESPDLVEVLPEEVEELLEEESPRQAAIITLFKKGPLGKLLGLINRLLDRFTGEDRGVLEAGVNLQGTSRRLGARMWRAAARKSALDSRVPLDSPQDFARLLEPLSPADVILLQKEIEADATIISQVDTVRRTALLQQRKGMLIGIIVGLFFALLAGPNYVLETLYTPGSEIWGSIVFALGIILPMGAIFQIAEGARLLFLYKEDPRPETKRIGLALIILPVLSLIILLIGAVPLAALPILIAWVWNKVAQRRE